jgi:acyl carrier protein
VEGAQVADGIEEEVRRTVGLHAQLSVDMDDVDKDDDLFQLGMTFHSTVNVLLALEEAFDIEFPDDLLENDTFRSLSTMETVVSSLVDKRRTA